MSEERLVLAGTRRAYKELVDGTLRVQIDIEPKDKEDFHRLFPGIDMPVALAPLAAHINTDPPRERLGPLALSAVQICKEQMFQRYVTCMSGGSECEENARAFVIDQCRIASRKDLDRVDGAKERFGDVMARYREWQRI